MLVCVIIRRFFLTEMMKVFFAVAGILLLVAVSNRFMLLINRAANGDFSILTLFKMLGYYIPDLLALLLPLSLFLSALLVVGRLYSDREMVVLMACGMPWRILLVPLMRFATLIMVIVALLTIWLMPAIHYQRENLLVQEESSVLLQTITPERFHAIQGGKVIFYVEKVSDKQHHLQGIFIAEKPEHPKAESEAFQWSILTAHKGQIIKEKGLPYFLLMNGVRYEGKPGHKDYTKVSFSRYERIIDEKPKKVPDFHRVTPTLDLLHHEAPGYQAEFQWRLSLPISVLIFGLLAFPLAKTSPRAGRYEKLLPSILLYIVYYNLLALSKRWVENGALPPFLGLWWVHLVMLSFAAYLWAKQTK